MLFKAMENLSGSVPFFFFFLLLVVVFFKFLCLLCFLCSWVFCYVLFFYGFLVSGMKLMRVTVIWHNMNGDVVVGH